MPPAYFGCNSQITSKPINSTSNILGIPVRHAYIATMSVPNIFVRFCFGEKK